MKSAEAEIRHMQLSYICMYGELSIKIIATLPLQLQDGLSTHHDFTGECMI